MKTSKTATDKITKSFDKELKSILLTDLKVMRVAKKNSEKLLMTA